MKSIILYSSEVPGPSRQSIRVGNTLLYIRAVVARCDVASALNMAKPQPGEIVLNTVPFPGDDWREHAPEASTIVLPP